MIAVRWYWYWVFCLTIQLSGGHMSVRSRSDMMIKTNMIWFPHWGAKKALTSPNVICSA